MKKTYDIIVIVIMIICVSLIFARFFFSVPAVIICILALNVSIVALPNFIKNPKQYIGLLFTWIFVTIIWGIIAIKEINEKFEVKEQQLVELIYKT